MTQMKDYRGTWFYLAIGDTVNKKKGYPFPGVVRTIFRTAAGDIRCVVECTAPGVEGCLHIYDPEQLFVVERAAE